MNQQKEKMKNTIPMIIMDIEKYGLKQPLPSSRLSCYSRRKNFCKSNREKISTQLRAYSTMRKLLKQQHSLLSEKLAEIKAEALKEAVQHANQNFQQQTRVLQ